MDSEKDVAVPAAVANWKENERASRARKRSPDGRPRDRTEPPLTPNLPLSAREETVGMLFAEGHTADEIGLVLGLSVETIRAYLVRARLKYKNAGRPATDKLQLRARLVEDGYLNE
jgi:DNA-binding CsgD family transcriptional regulator